MSNSARTTISLPRDLLEFADVLAKERSTSRSGLIAGLIREEQQRHLERLMAEGYREMSDENSGDAEEALNLTAMWSCAMARRGEIYCVQRGEGSQPLLDRHRFGQVPGLVHVAASADRDMVGKQLHRHGHEHWGEV